MLSHKWAVEYDVMACVMTWHPIWGWGLGLVAWACRGVVGSAPEAVGVVGIKAVGDSKAKDDGADEVVSVGNGCLNGWWGFVAFWGCTGDVGWVVGWGVVLLDVGRGNLLP